MAINPKSETGLEIDLISGCRIDYRHAITEQQAELLTACAIGGIDANRAFNQSITLEFSGNVSIPALLSALDDLVARNDNFRTVFDLTSKSALVLSSVNVTPQIKTIALNEDPEFFINELQNAGALLAFDLRKGPLFRFSILHQGQLGAFLLLEMHHVVCDGWSLALIIQELASLYGAHVQGLQVNLPQAISYQKFVESEKLFHSSKEYIQTCDFWKGKFNSYKPQPSLPYSKSRPADFSYESAHICYPLEESLFGKLRHLSDINGTSILVTMASVFEVLLYRKTGAKKLVIGFPTAAQVPSGLDKLMGHCVNMLPVLSHLDDKLKFRDYLLSRKNEFSEAFNQRRVTFGNILKHINFDRGQSSLPFIPVTFNIDRPLLEQDIFHGLSTKMRVNKRAYSSFDMIVNVSRVNDKLVIECDYNKVLFDDFSIRELLTQYEYLLSNLSDNPDQLISTCDLYDLDLIQQRLSEFNSTKLEFPSDLNVIELIKLQADSSPNKTALIFESQSFSYLDLCNEVSYRAKALKGAGLNSGDFVGVMLDRGPEMLFQMLAVVQAGGAYIPIDPEFPMDRIRYMLEDSGAKILLTHSSHKEIGENLCLALTPEELKTFYSETILLDKIDTSNAAYVLYTSGSTGRPKGVQMSQKSLTNLLWSMKSKPGFTDKDTLFAITTISFDISGLELYLPLICGGKLVLASSKVSKSGDHILDIIKEQNVTVLQATPATYRLILSYGFESNQNLKLLCGGEPLSLDLAKEILSKCKELWNLYGPTETCIWSSIHQINTNDAAISIGHPINNTQIYILDERHRPVPPGTQGEIAIAGDGLAIGYLNRKDLTDEKFIQHPWDSESKIYLTGDLGYVSEDNKLYCLGRTDHQIKVRGYRIETGEIESVLISDGNYKEAVVIARNFGKDDLRIVAFLKESGLSQRSFKTDKDTGIQLDVLGRSESEYLRMICALKLPDYMIPSVFVIVNAMPLTPNAKTDRKLLSEINPHCILDNLSKHQRQAGCEETQYWNSTELALKPLWESALGITNAGKRDDFFASGGHSLIAIELMHDIEKNLGIRLPLASLFKTPNIEALAQLIDGDVAQDYQFLVPIKSSGSGVPLYLVHGAGLEVMVFKEFSEFMDVDQPIIGVQAIGLNSDQMPPDDLENIVSEYINEIKRHNRSGTFLIAGFSAGSLIAFEMARQLEASGAHVAMCGIFDYSLETTKVNRPFWDKVIKNVFECIPRRLYSIAMLFKYPSYALKYQKNYFKLAFNGIL
ncbi:MAG: amino acid adenylation domain-containing protein, partial [Bacteroidia bacterium]|nr:amino acid adenylation domain-containing protein [Bacteroidia bacterium]